MTSPDRKSESRAGLTRRQFIGATAAAAGTLLMPFLGLNSLGAFLSGRLARRLGRVKMIVVVGCVGAAAGFFLLATMTGATGPLL